MVVTPVNGHNRPRPPSPGAELYQELVDHFRFLLTTSSVLPLWSLRDPLVFWSGARLFWKKMSGETKGRMARWLSRSDAESCKCCKCCKFRPDHNLSAKIWALYWKPKTTLSLVFSVKIVWWFDWIFWQMHRNSLLCQATPYCFMINVMLLCNNIYSINSVTAIIYRKLFALILRVLVLMFYMSGTKTGQLEIYNQGTKVYS